jgi:hypothetical protein
MGIKSKRWKLLFWLGSIGLLLRALMPLIGWIKAAFCGAREEGPVPPSIGLAGPEGEDRALSPQQIEWEGEWEKVREKELREIKKELREIKDRLKELLRREDEPKEPRGRREEWEKVWERYDQTFMFIFGVFFSMAAELVAQIFRLRVLAFCMMLVLIILIVIVFWVHWVSHKEKA